MTSEEMIALLNDDGYFACREIPGRGWCGLHRQIFTVSLCYGLDETGYHGRYCYPNLLDAVVALAKWTGEGDPDDEDWIKHKGFVEYPNPKNKNYTQDE